MLNERQKVGNSDPSSLACDQRRGGSSADTSLGEGRPQVRMHKSTCAGHEVGGPLLESIPPPSGHFTLLGARIPVPVRKLL